MASVAERLLAIRERRPVIDHVLRMQEHYGMTKASQQAGGVTYFAFLSIFPLLALAFFVVGLLSQFYPQADADVRAAINSVLPGLIGGENGISLDDVRTFSGLAAVVGVLGVLYSGLGWITALREALTAVLDTAAEEQPSFVVGKLRDLVTLVLLGLTLLVAVAVTGVVRGASATILGWVGLGEELGWLAQVVALVLGLGANVVLFYLMFRLARSGLPARPLWSGALLGAVAFEVLKVISQLLLAGTRNQPAFQAFGIALVLVVWINYTSRVVLYSAAWAYTAPQARAARSGHPARPVAGPSTPPLSAPVEQTPAEGRAAWLVPFAAGGAAMLTVIAAVRRRGR